MFRYEILIVSVPEITGDESSALEMQIGKVIEEHKSTLLSFDRWGKYRLAYPVRRNDYGVYFLIRFETSEEHMQALLSALTVLLTVKYNELVMRHLIVRLNPQAPLTYQRPESLEEAPSKSVDSFIKNKRFGGGQDANAAAEFNNDEDSLIGEL